MSLNLFHFNKFTGYSAWLVLLSVCSIAYGAETIVLQGNVVYSSQPNGVMQNGRVVPLSSIPRTLSWGKWTNSFSMTLSTDGSWMMEVSPMNFPGDLMYGHKQVIYQTFDKTNIYGAYYSEGVTKNRKVIGATDLTNLTHFANISLEDYPMADLNMLPNLNVQFTPNILWLAFGSSDFFAKQGSIITSRSIISSRAQCLEFYGVRWDCEFLPDQPHLPQQVQFLRDTNLDLPIEKEISRPEVPKPENIEEYKTLLSDIKQRKDNYTNNYLWATYKCLARTNLNGICVPTEFEYKRYSPTVATPEGLVSLVVGTITSISNSHKSEIELPPVIAPLDVNDARFQRGDIHGRVDSIHYELNPGQKWPDRNSPALQDLFKRADATVYSPLRAKLTWRIGAVLYFIFMVGVPIWLYRKANKRL